MNVEFAGTARTDLRDIGFHIAADNVPRSITFVEELRDRCLTLADHPERFPEAIRVRDRSLRKMTHGGYLIFYTIRTPNVRILRIVHASRNWSRLFQD